MAHKIDAEKCVACGCCKDACPAEGISEGTPYAIDPDKGVPLELVAFVFAAARLPDEDDSSSPDGEIMV